MNTAGLTRLMSKKGCSPDNAACEGFFGRLKNEMFYGRSWIDVSINSFIDEIIIISSGITPNVLNNLWDI